MSREKQSQYDRMTGQPVEKLILELGLPTTISMLVTNLYNMADTYFVGHWAPLRVGQPALCLD